MSDPALEPTRVAPVPGGHVRASDHDRDQVANVLSTAFAEGRLSQEEHDERMDSLLRAKTFDDLVALTRDLVVVGTPAAPVAGRPTARRDIAASEGPVDRMVAVFAGTERKGRWRVGSRIQTLAVFGGLRLDLREAVLESQVVEISGFWCFGGLDIKVPEGVEVRNEVVSIFGGSDVKHLGPPEPGSALIVVKGLALFSGVSVKGPRPSRWFGPPRMGGGHGGHGWHRR